MTTATPLKPAVTLPQETPYNEFPLTWGDLARRVLAALLPMAVLGGAVHMTYDVEALIGWFPVCLLLSILLQFAIVPTRSWWALLFAMAPSLGTIACGTVIAANEWGPYEAQLPIPLLWWCFTVGILALGVHANRVIWSYRRRAEVKGRFRWQFPLQFLLVQMVLLSLVLALLKLVVPDQAPFMVFGYGAALVFLVVGIAFSLFLANLKDNRPAVSTNPWDESEVPAPVDAPPNA
jgi:hypothetical protein